jgi:hypothetical protein
MKKLHLPLVCCIVLLNTCIAIHAQPNRDCRATPRFLSSTGLDIKNVAFSTSDRKRMGLIAIEISSAPGTIPKVYQHPTWKNAGWLGPMVVTEKGEIWVAPVPMINTTKNKPQEQNRIWKLDANTGEMTIAVELPVPDIELENQNPYGLLGLGYDCDNAMLYASSVAGSTIYVARGKLYGIQTSDKKITSTIDSLDAFGVGIGTVNGTKRLYFGKARIGEIYSIGLNTDGTFNGSPRLELSLDNLGPRGDDRARKIRFTPDGTMTVTGSEFYFNLTAPTEKQETIYQFKYNAADQQWILVGMQ